MTINIWANQGNIQIPRDVAEFQVPEVEEQPEFWRDTVSASLGYQYAPVINFIKNTIKYGDRVEVGYNPLEDMEGYEQYQSHLIHAQSREHMADLKLEVDNNLRRRQVLQDSSVISQFGAGIFDPINLVALPFGGPALGFGRAAMRTGTSVAALQTGLEAVRYPFDPLATPQESAMNIGSAFVTGGMIGGLLSVPATRRASTIRKTNDEIAEFVEATQGFTSEDLRLIGQKEAREFGADTDEVLNVQRTSLPKVIDALEDSIAKLEVERVTGDQPKARLDEIDGEIQAKTLTVQAERKNLSGVRKEQQLRRAEKIQELDVSDAHGMASNFYTDSWIYKGVTTPMKRILQGVIPDSVKELTVKLAGDSGVLLKLNELGIASPKSVFQYAATRNGEWLKVYTSMLDKFGQHTQKGSPIMVTDVNLSNMDGSFGKFLRDTNEKYIRGEAGSTAAQAESIELLRGFYKDWENRLNEVGILGNMKSMQAKIIRAEKSFAKMSDEISFLETLASLNKKQTRRLENLRTRRDAMDSKLDELESEMSIIKEETSVPRGEEVMFPRYWDRDAIKANRQEFANILFDWFTENNVVRERVDYEGRPLRNFSQLSDEELAARFGAEFGISEFKTEAGFFTIFRDDIIQDRDLRTFNREVFGFFDIKGRAVNVNRTKIFKAYQRYKEQMQDPAAAYKKLNEAGDASTAAWNHRKFIYDNWNDFKSFNDFQDFVIAHEMHHAKIFAKYKEDDVSFEMRVNEGAINFVRKQKKELRSRRPAYVERELPDDADSVMTRVNTTIDQIIGITDPANDQVAFYGSNRSKHFRHRTLDIPNELVTEFIQMDPMAVMRAYTQRVAPQYEFAKMYGGKSLEDLLDDIDDDMYAAGKSLAETNKVRRDFTHLYDRVVGTVLEDPTAISQRTATVLRDAAQLNYLGSAGFSTLPDFAKIMMEHELGDVFKALFGILKDERVRMNATEGKLAGEILEIIAGDSHMRLVDEVTNNPFSQGFYQKNVSKLKWGFYLANLLAPMTNVMKKLDATVRSHTLIDMSMRVAGAEGKKPTKFDIEYLARYGIGKAEAKQFAELVENGTIQKTENGLYLPNTESWPKQHHKLRQEFRSSMNSGIMNTILMGTPADKPLIVDGVAYVPMRIAKMFGATKESTRYRGYYRIENGFLGLPFQFYSYTLAAVNKITASYATGQARNRVMAMVTGMGLAYAGLELKNMGRPYVMDNMSLADKIARSFDMSGTAALYSDIFYTSMHVSSALGGPDVGMGLINPKRPVDEGYGNAALEVLGAGPSIGQEVGEGVYDFTRGDYGEGAKKIIRAMPTARLWIWRDFMNEATNALSDTLPNEAEGIYSRSRF